MSLITHFAPPLTHSAGYQVTTGVISAVHFGSCQPRVRVFVCGARRGLEPLRIPTPTHVSRGGRYRRSMSFPDVPHAVFVQVFSSYSCLPAANHSLFVAPPLVAPPRSLADSFTTGVPSARCRARKNRQILRLSRQQTRRQKRRQNRRPRRQVAL